MCFAAEEDGAGAWVVSCTLPSREVCLCAENVVVLHATTRIMSVVCGLYGLFVSVVCGKECLGGW